MPKSSPVSVRLNPETLHAAEDLARRTSRPLGAVVSELAEEALRARRYPGIAFAGPPGNRRARVEGTGIDVWEVLAVHRACRGDVDRTARTFQHMTRKHLEAALRYARAYTDEVETLVNENERSRAEWERLFPHLASAGE